ncbi:hypothetical protein I3842_13G015700 [Carya illinoinensis]|uniref:Uncharacterized protein n=1 Tax=Carya illinoinensis TaxID=32201 RepID=A0A922DA40_CARIL|nr:hypothetical protein I3842_13G015700 [Carya illinoinensis]
MYDFYKIGEELKRQIGAIAYIECISMTQQNLKAIFDTSIKLVLDPPKSKKPKRKQRTYIFL